MTDSQNNLRRRVFSPAFLLIFAFLMAACGDQPIAFTDNVAEANRMFDVLYSSGLNVKKVQRGGEKPEWDIIIDEGWFGGGEAAAATQILNDYGLPRQKEVLPATTNPYGVTSEEETRKRQNREKEIQIANHLYSLPGIISTSVIVAQPENEILSLQKTPPTASVLIVQKEPQPRFTHTDVQKLVSSSVPELKAENITVSISEQALREIPLAQLDAQRRSNKILALGIGLITLLIGALGGVWLMIKRRKRLAETNLRELAAEDEFEELV